MLVCCAVHMCYIKTQMFFKIWQMELHFSFNCNTCARCSLKLECTSFICNNRPGYWSILCNGALCIIANVFVSYPKKKNNSSKLEYKRTKTLWTLAFWFDILILIWKFIWLYAGNKFSSPHWRCTMYTGQWTELYWMHVLHVSFITLNWSFYVIRWLQANTFADVTVSINIADCRGPLLRM